ncbi:hypothetical protein [Fulvimonas soli]|nr:hypothetical protein [Fulvimonas soli]TNY25663.1 hypothetical protein BV497_12310 [Fulvimonas soli]
MTPSNFSECGGPNVVAHVKWRASDNPDDPISIYVSSVGQPPKLWYTGAHSGELDTGPWMSDGATLLLQDARGKVLARRTMTSTDCPPGAPVAGH